MIYDFSCMNEEILLNIDKPRRLEQLYRNDKPGFKTAFNALYPQLRDNLLAEGWYQRLNYGSDDLSWGTPEERIFMVGGSLLAAFLAKLPAMLSLNNEFYYTRNIGFIVFPILIAYFGQKNTISWKTAAWLGGLMLLAIGYINWLPQSKPDDTLNLACIHLPLCLWSMVGFTFGGGKVRAGEKWLGFLRYNGDLLVMMVLLLIAAGITTAITIGLFELIGYHIQKVYFNYVVICGLAAVPIVGTFLTQVQPTLVSKVAPVIANLFSPVALVMLLIYLGVMIFSGKDPYHDREFLLLFNGLLVGVMSLIFFSVAETTRKNLAQVAVLFLLSVVTILVNGVALSAVVFRISEWGITPNRAAVLGANGLMLAHLLYICLKLMGALTRKSDLALVGKSVAIFLPIYSVWCAIVTFLFPVLFGFR